MRLCDLLVDLIRMRSLLFVYGDFVLFPQVFGNLGLNAGSYRRSFNSMDWLQVTGLILLFLLEDCLHLTGIILLFAFGCCKLCVMIT